MLNHLQSSLERPQNERIKKEKRARSKKKNNGGQGDKGARRGGKHNLNFEDQVVFLLFVRQLKHRHGINAHSGTL